jgi:hypothetical protein
MHHIVLQLLDIFLAAGKVAHTVCCTWHPAGVSTLLGLSAKVKEYENGGGEIPGMLQNHPIKLTCNTL